METTEILHDDDRARAKAIAEIEAAPQHIRSAMASKLSPIAREAAALATNCDDEHATTLARACTALAVLRVEAAKRCLFRIADEGSSQAKTTLARALSATKTQEGRDVLVHLLSDDEAVDEAVIAIGAAPWPEILQSLIELAEADERVLALAIVPIAKCGEIGGPNEAGAAADFLLELLDDNTTAPTAAIALLRYGRAFPGVPSAARRIARQRIDRRKVPSLCVVAAYDQDEASFLELARSDARLDVDAARRFLEPLLDHADERIRAAAARTWQALDLK